MKIFPGVKWIDVDELANQLSIEYKSKSLGHLQAFVASAMFHRSTQEIFLISFVNYGIDDFLILRTPLKLELKEDTEYGFKASWRECRIGFKDKNNLHSLTLVKTLIHEYLHFLFNKFPHNTERHKGWTFKLDHFLDK